VPSDFGLPQSSLEDLQGDDRETNAAIIRAVLAGDPAAPDIVVATPAAALLVAERTPRLKSRRGAFAAESIDKRRARQKLEQLTEFTAQGLNEVV